MMFNTVLLCSFQRCLSFQEVFTVTSGLGLISNPLPVCAHDHLIVVAEVEEYTEIRSKPEPDDAPVELEDTEKRDGDANDPVTDDCSD